MTQESLMLIDAVALMWLSFACSLRLTADRTMAFMPMAFIGTIGAASFIHAMWLLGIWWPRPGGYPLPRLIADIAMAGYFTWRTGPAVADQWRDERRSREMRRREAQRE